MLMIKKKLSMRWANANIESDLRCINPLTPSPEGFY